MVLKERVISVDANRFAVERTEGGLSYGRDKNLLEPLRRILYFQVQQVGRLFAGEPGKNGKNFLKESVDKDRDIFYFSENVPAMVGG